MSARPAWRSCRSLTGRPPEFSISGPRRDDVVENLVTSCMSARLEKTGKEMKFGVTGAANGGSADTSLMGPLVRARRISLQLLASYRPTLDAIEEQKNMTPSYASRAVRLAILAPDVVELARHSG